MKVYLVRHGQTNFNANKIHDGNKGFLTETGKNQTEQAAKRFIDLNIDTLLASPFDRTKQTAGIISKAIDKPIIYSELFIEMKRPTEIEGKGYEDSLSLEVKKQIVENYTNPNWHHSDEENFFELKARALAGLDFLEQQTGENIVLVTHHDIMKLLVSVMLFGKELTPENYLKIRLFFGGRNTGITICEYKDNKWNLISWSDHSHLD